MNSFIVLSCPIGKYTWWPVLQTVDFTPKGKLKSKYVDSLPVEKNTEVYAIARAAKHLHQMLYFKELEKKNEISSANSRKNEN